MKIKVCWVFKSGEFEATGDATIEIAPADVVAIARAAMADDDDDQAPADDDETADAVAWLAETIEVEIDGEMRTMTRDEYSDLLMDDMNRKMAATYKKTASTGPAADGSNQDPGGE